MYKKLKKIAKIVLPNYCINKYNKYNNKKIKQNYLKQFNNLIIGNNTHISNNCYFEKGVKISNNTSLNNVSIGKYSYFAGDSSITNCKFGRYCSIATNVKIGLRIHPSKNLVTTHPAFYSTLGQSTITYTDDNYFQEFLPINIENDVWIGYGATIKDGVTIGNGAIIGAMAVVVKNVEPYSIIGGVPAKLIKYRFTKEEINFLLNFKWWNKPEDWIKQNWKYFLNIKKFMEKYNLQ